ncbi:MAG: phosphatase, partial [Microbacteriaceae bacterium]
DTSDGWAEASQTAHELGMGLVPGLELSTQNNGRSIHIVSYLVDPLHAELQEELLKIRGERVLRAKTIVDNIAQDYDFAWELVAEQAPPGTTVGRPHIADALVKAGFSEDRSAAFREILHPSRGYTIPTYAPEPWAGTELIRRAGGVPVLAHPGTSTRTIIPKEALAKLVDAGLFGLEIEHPENLDERKVQLYELAKYFNLAVTGSSDWHGTGKVNRLGERTTDPAVFELLMAEASGSQAILPQ